MSITRKALGFFRSEKSDLLFAVLIFLVAFALRAPNIGYPSEPALDEYMYAVLTTDSTHHVPYFEIHPPLSRMIFAGLAGSTSLLPPVFREDLPKAKFGDFPYEKIRVLMALIGSLLPVIIFLLSRNLGFSAFSSSLVSGLLVFDGALISSSRIMEPDMIMLFFGFLGILLLIFSHKRASGFLKVLLSILAGFLLGAAVSVKWIGAGFLAIALIYVLLKKDYRSILGLILIPAAVYISLFLIFISNLHGPIELRQNYYDRDYVKSLVFPGENARIGEKLGFIYQYNLTMFRLNSDRQFMERVITYGMPLEWPFGLENHIYWVKDGKKTGFAGNLVAWNIAFLSLIALVISTARKIFKRQRPADTEILISAGYLIYYLPFLLIAIARPMYPYHYMTALVFAFLAIPLGLPKIFKFITDKETIPARFYWIAGAAYVLFMVILLPFVYGF